MNYLMFRNYATLAVGEWP